MELRIFKTNATSGFVKALQSAPNSFSRELCPGPRWGRLQRFPDSLDGLRGVLLKERGGRLEKGGEGERKGRGGAAPLRKFLDLPV